MKQLRAKRRHIVMACVFVFLAATPLCLIPFFPEVWLMQLLYSSQAAVLGVVICAGIISALIDRMLHGRNDKIGTPHEQ
jgi:hypothetical protein